MTHDATEARSKWSGEDLLSQDGASRLAGEIRDYWRERGYEVHTRVEQIAHSSGRPVSCVRSDLRNGLPADFRCEDLAALTHDLRGRWPHTPTKSVGDRQWH